MTADILQRKKTHFVLWRPGATKLAPTLYIGSYQPGSDKKIENFKEIPLQQSEQFPEIWEVEAKNCSLTEGQVYFYWFKVGNTEAYDAASTSKILYCTDPTAWTVDRRFLAPVPSEPGGIASYDPASVVLYKNGELTPCDANGQTVDWEGDGSLEALAPNNRLVIYELPTRWARIDGTGPSVEGDGTFRDVISL